MYFFWRGWWQAIDASMSIYQFLIAVRQLGEGQLTNDSGEVTSHLTGMLPPLDVDFTLKFPTANFSAPAGTAVVFDSFHGHEVLPSKRRRYALTLWLFHEPLGFLVVRHPRAHHLSLLPCNQRVRRGERLPK